MSAGWRGDAGWWEPGGGWWEPGGSGKGSGGGAPPGSGKGGKGGGGGGGKGSGGGGGKAGKGGGGKGCGGRPPVPDDEVIYSTFPLNKPNFPREDPLSFYMLSQQAEDAGCTVTLRSRATRHRWYRADLRGLPLGGAMKRVLPQCSGSLGDLRARPMKPGGAKASPRQGRMKQRVLRGTLAKKQGKEYQKHLALRRGSGLTTPRGTWTLSQHLLGQPNLPRLAPRMRDLLRIVWLLLEQVGEDPSQVDQTWALDQSLCREPQMHLRPGCMRGTQRASEAMQAAQEGTLSPPPTTPQWWQRFCGARCVAACP